MDTWIQFGMLLIALVSLIVQQTRTLREQQKHEARIETKLKLFHILLGSDLSEAQIVDKYKQDNRNKTVDKSEIRKALYEMLTEETIFYQENKTYRAHWRHIKGLNIAL